MRIDDVRGLEVLDSRGNPTVRVMVRLDDGTVAKATVPSGASTGANEAVELRDGDKGRYGGKGVRTAVAAVDGEIAARLRGMDPTKQSDVDAALIDLDGTPNKSRLGANAIVGTSMAVARAAAAAAKMPLYAYLGGEGARRLPVPMMNVLNGGKHASNKVAFQEFMLVPLGFPAFSEALRAGVETFHTLARILEAEGYSTGVGDEGGFAPDLWNDEEACRFLVRAIAEAGYEPEREIAIAIDPAASSFYWAGLYELEDSGWGTKRTPGMVDLYADWVVRYPIVSIEDGLAEDDWDGFQQLTARLGDTIQIVGDDIFVTDPTYIKRGIAEHTANSALIKLNQIGTVTETVEAVDTCRKAGWSYVISHRSGETEDDFIADFAVAMGGGQIKTGSACRSERICKYNRLLEIEAELGDEAVFRWR